MIHRLFHGINSEKVFHKVLENLRILARLKIESGSRMGLGVGVIVNPLNIDDLAEIALRIKEIDSEFPGTVNSLAYRPTVRYEGGCQFTPSTDLAIEYVKNNTRLKRHYEAYRDFFYKNKQFPQEFLDEALDILEGEVKPVLQDTKVQVSIPYDRFKGSNNPCKPFGECIACGWVSFITPDGSMYHCVELALEPRLVIGNILKHSLDTIWQSQKRREVIDFINREGLYTISPPVCLLYEYNKTFYALKQAMVNSPLLWENIKSEIRLKSNTFIQDVKRKVESDNFAPGFENFMFPLKVPKKSAVEAQAEYGKNFISQGVILSSIGLEKIPDGFSKAYLDILSTRMEELLKSITVRGPPELTSGLSKLCLRVGYLLLLKKDY